MDAVVFSIAGKEYGIDIACVREVIRPGKIIFVPEAPVFVEGVITWHGKVMPLINIRKKLDVDQGGSDRLTRIIITDIQGHLVGFLVDRISGLIALQPHELVPPDDVFKKAAYLMGIARVGKRLILMMDIDKVFNDQDKMGIDEVHTRLEVRRRV